MNKKQLDEERNKLIMRVNSADVYKELEDDPHNPDLWFKLGIALTDEQGPDAGIDAFSQGLVYNPFNAGLYFGRGRKNIGLGHYWRAIADTTMAIRLEPEKWNHWYYRGVTNNLNRCYKESIADFEQCMLLIGEEEHYPLIDWLFQNYVDLGQMDKARATLDRIDTAVIPPTMDNGYRARVRLYKGEVTPEKFIDMDEISKTCLQLPGRVELEVTSMTYGLYNYFTYKGETEKANEVLSSLVGRKPAAAFAVIKGTMLAKDRGLV